MSREEFEAIWAPEPHRREPRGSAPHRRHAESALAGVDPLGRGATIAAAGHRIGVRTRDGRLRHAVHRAAGSPHAHLRRRHSELPQ